MRSAVNLREIFFRSNRVGSSSSESGSQPDISLVSAGDVGRDGKGEVRSGEGRKFQGGNVGECSLATYAGFSSMGSPSRLRGRGMMFFVLIVVGGPVNFRLGGVRRPMAESGDVMAEEGDLLSDKTSEGAVEVVELNDPWIVEEDDHSKEDLGDTARDNSSSWVGVTLRLVLFLDFW